MRAPAFPRDPAHLPAPYSPARLSAPLANEVPLPSVTVCHDKRSASLPTKVPGTLPNVPEIPLSVVRQNPNDLVNLQRGEGPRPLTGRNCAGGKWRGVVGMVGVVVGLLLGARAGAVEPRFILRLATVAPDGTPWAREVKAFAREVESLSSGEVQVKWYLGAIAGNEGEVEERMRRGQLDGTASSGMLCQRVAPSMRVLRLTDVFNSRDESTYVLGRLNSTLVDEARTSGYVLLGTTGLGPDVVLSRAPIHSLAELRKARMWRWDLDDVGVALSRQLGFNVVTLPVESAARAFDDGKIDGFLGIPTAALAFQWFSRARYLLDLRMGYLGGCLFLTNRAFDRLPMNHQQSLRTAGAKLAVRFNDAGREMDDRLLGGLFQKQGVKTLPTSEAMRTDFLAAAKAARQHLGDKLVPAALLERVVAFLVEYRAEHHEKSK